MVLKELVRAVVHGLGYEVRRFDPAASQTAQMMRMIQTHSIDVVLDVGANAGQFGRELRQSGYRGRIVSFEPLSGARAQLRKTIGRDSRWILAERAALGASDGEVELHVAANSVSSSVLPMLATHASAEPASKYVGTEAVPLRRLDDLVSNHVNGGSRIFLKIDTQGYEDRVLQGAERTLETTVGLRLELSLVPLYEGQLLYDEMVPRLRALGFEVWHLSPAFIDSRDGRLLQVDGTFFRV